MVLIGERMADEHIIVVLYQLASRYAPSIEWSVTVCVCVNI